MNKKQLICLSILLLSLLSLPLQTDVLAQEETVCEEGFRLFDHELLATDPVCIPENPQRIVAFDTPAAELLFFTERQLIGGFMDELLPFAASINSDLINEKLADVTYFRWPVNLELLLGLEPDLIASYNLDALSYETLSAIAPTVIISTGIMEGNWHDSTQFWAEVYGETALYEEMVATYEARADELRAALGEDRGETEVSLVLASSFYDLLATADSPQGYLIRDVGLGRPASQDLDEAATLAEYGNKTYIVLNDELLGMADGDVILLFTFPSGTYQTSEQANRYLDKFQENPLWQSLNAVRNGQVYEVGPHWIRANTYLLANLMLDDLFNLLTDTQSTIPNPIVAFGNEADVAE